jgi:cobyrinic acid a,c-diamide synthase
MQRGDDPRPATWALMSFLHSLGWQIQHFRAQACFSGVDGGRVVCGVPSRHLDSWLMTADVCRELFVRGAASCDLAVVEGTFCPVQRAALVAGTMPAQPTCPELGRRLLRLPGPVEPPEQEPATAAMLCRLDTLCDWLRLPRVAILDVSRWNDCCLPPRPAADGLLLDGVADARQFFHLQTVLESLWRIPVVGGLDRLPAVRESLQALRGGGVPSKCQCAALAASFARYAQVERLRQLSTRYEFDPPPPQLFQPAPCRRRRRVRIAVAYDESLQCYFPEVIELLEFRGAVVEPFSPLKDDRLPPDSDIVYLGCGHPEEFLSELSANQCLMQSLLNHVRQGKRLYAEGGGLAYLCQFIETDRGRRYPMVGVLPALARRAAEVPPPRPVQLTMARGNWLAPCGSSVRGYLNRSWQLHPLGRLASYAAEAGHEHDLVGNRRALGSRLHVHFVPQPGLLAQFLTPAVGKRA